LPGQSLRRISPKHHRYGKASYHNQRFVVQAANEEPALGSAQNYSIAVDTLTWVWEKCLAFERSKCATAVLILASLKYYVDPPQRSMELSGVIIEQNHRRCFLEFAALILRNQTWVEKKSGTTLPKFGYECGYASELAHTFVGEAQQVWELGDRNTVESEMGSYLISMKRKTRRKWAKIGLESFETIHFNE
jgi:hypothetical protein